MHQNPESGLIQLASGAWAWLAPGNSWGWSNAGLISDGEESLLVDTLYDLALTSQMLDKMRDAEPQANNIDTLVNTHANGDHCHGNELAEYSAWSDPERIAVNVDSLYREFRGEKEASDVFELFARMAALAGYDVDTP